ncbi:putative flavin-binding monooxygenase [Teratosphaeria destructans]|uniref:Flavin-binding monooxygenase n=1 Tax=Teratosphaeria destructans TaxID=418781 RepID=A0A9W7T167_9PEZI|nr:putative flavin-binding monooxygenase [Teratosphaeria destructans]
MQWAAGDQTPGNGYLECLTDEEKGQVSFSPIQEITENAVCTQDGRVHEVDVLICATGSDVSFQPRFPVVGRHGRALAAAWDKTPETYLSATAPGVPKYFRESPRVDHDDR